MNNIRKIITHSGKFHADEVMAVALIKEFVTANIPVERTRDVSTGDFSDPEVWVIDVGKKYEPELSNFDHHQDSQYPASCVLIALHLLSKGVIKESIYNEMQEVFNTISDIDCNGYEGYTGFQFNGLIKSFNNIEDGWSIAVETCRAFIKACVSTANLEEKSRETWNRGEKISCYIRYCDEFPVHWKRYEERAFSYLST